MSSSEMNRNARAGIGWTWALYEWPEYFEAEMAPAARRRWMISLVVFGVAFELLVAPLLGLPRGVMAIGCALNVVNMAQAAALHTYERHPRLQSTLSGLLNTSICVVLPSLSERFTVPLWCFLALYVLIAARAFAPSVLYALAVVVLPLLGAAAGLAVRGRVDIVEHAAVAGLMLGAYVLLAIVHSQQRVRDGERRVLAQREAAFDERERVAADLHDTLGSTLAEIGLWIDIAQRSRDALQPKGSVVGSVDDDPLLRARERARAALRELRTVVNGFDDDDVPAPRASSLLSSRLRGLCDAAGVAFSVDVDGDAVLPAEQARDVLKIAEEAVVNAVRHGGPQRVTVAVTWSARPRLRIADDGRGFESGRVREGGGLRSMRARAAALGAPLVIERGAGGGTVVVVDCDA